MWSSVSDNSNLFMSLEDTQGYLPFVQNSERDIDGVPPPPRIRRSSNLAQLQDSGKLLGLGMLTLPAFHSSQRAIPAIVLQQDVSLSQAPMLPEPPILEVHRLDTQAGGNVLCDAVKPFALFGRKRLLRVSLRQPSLIAFVQFLTVRNERKAGNERMTHQDSRGPAAEFLPYPSPLHPQLPEKRTKSAWD